MQGFSDAAQWVIPPAGERNHKSQSNEWFMFRSNFRNDEACSGVLKIAADSKYWLYLNGELVVREGGLKRGPVPNGTYYDEVDVSGSLKSGENTIAVLLWYFGRNGFSHRDSGVPGLLVDAEFPMVWKVKKHPAFFDAGYIHDAYRLSENSVGFDARYDLPEWFMPEFNDSDWSAGVPAERAGAGVWGCLEKREFPQWFWSEVKEFESVSKSKSEDGDGYFYLHCKLPYNTHFVPALTVKATAGIKIEITVSQDTNRLCPVYITKDGVQSYECSEWMNGEQVIFKIPSDAVRIISVGYRETGFPSEFAGSFSCNESQLNELWKKARRTLYVTMRDTFMDCPCRERAQWPGDMVVQLGQVPYCLNRNADLLVKKGIREMLRWQREDGIIYGPVPEGNWRMELPAQMLAVISRYGIWTYYMNTADRDTLEELYPYAKRYLDIWQFELSGLIKYRPDNKGEIPKKINGVCIGTWDWIDWGSRIDSEPALNAWFILAAQGVRLMAEELGKDNDAEELRQKENSVRAAFQKQYWNEKKEGFVSAGFLFEPDDRVQALAVLCDAVLPEQTDKIEKKLKTVHQASPYMEKYVLEALFRLDPSAAIERMQIRYKGLIEQGNSTLWERWPEWSDHPGTINHSWSGGPLTLLSEIAAGFYPITAGWKRMMIQPRASQFSDLSASMHTPHGDVSIDIKKSNERWTVKLIIPEHIIATVDLSHLGYSLPVADMLSGTHLFQWEDSLIKQKDSIYA